MGQQCSIILLVIDPTRPTPPNELGFNPTPLNSSALRLSFRSTRFPSPDSNTCPQPLLPSPATRHRPPATGTYAAASCLPSSSPSSCASSSSRPPLPRQIDAAAPSAMRGAPPARNHGGAVVLLAGSRSRR
jgi:hypothetical protein